MKYDGIIDLPHPLPGKRGKMSLRDRAAQFAPFSALSGLEDEMDETARLTDKAPVLSEDAADRLNFLLCRLRNAGDASPVVTLTYFRKDAKKPGGALVSVTGRLEKYDEYTGRLTLEGGDAVEVRLVVDVRL